MTLAIAKFSKVVFKKRVITWVIKGTYSEFEIQEGGYTFSDECKLMYGIEFGEIYYVFDKDIKKPYNLSSLEDLRILASNSHNRSISIVAQFENNKLSLELIK